jgi:thiol:disulfide interchange protein DsbA
LARLLLTFLALVACTSAPAQSTAPAQRVPASQYELVSPPQPTRSPGKVEVVELFWYGCPHCHELDPFLARWAKSAPEYVDFSRLPAAFPTNKLWRLHAEAFYAAEALGVLERVHGPFFDALHRARRSLGTREAVAAFFGELGVPAADLNRAWDSFAVQAKVRQAMSLTERYGVTGVPAIVVNGKYRTSASLTGSYDNLIKVVQALVDQEHRSQTGAPTSAHGTP